MRPFALLFGVMLALFGGGASIVLTLLNPDMTAARLWLTYPVLLSLFCVITIGGVVVIVAALRGD